MENISVYLNKKASHGSQDWKAQINSAFFDSHIEYPVSETIEELYAHLESDVKKNVDAIFSVGGDGTVHTIIQKLAGTDIGLLVVPGGTANDLAHGVGTSKNIKQMAHAIKSDIKKKMDLININGTFMATNGGVGFAADVAKEINDLRINYPQFKSLMKITGKNIYSLFLAKNILARDINSYKFKIDSNEFSETFFSSLVLINNQPVIGGNFKVAPFTDNRDGKFNVTIFKHSNRLELISCMLQILSGRLPSRDKNLVSFETNELTMELLEGADELPFFGDGEVFKSARKWHVKCHADFLNVFYPNDDFTQKLLPQNLQ